VSPMVIRLISVSDQMPLHEFHDVFRTILGCVSGHCKPASNGRNDPATKIKVSRHFSSKQARINSLMSGLFERKTPLFS
jgi:hypothetical protein